MGNGEEECLLSAEGTYGSARCGLFRLLDVGLDGHAVISAHGTVESASVGMARLCGYPSHQHLHGKLWGDWMQDSTGESFERAVRDALDERGTWKGSLQMTASSGQKIPVEVVALRLHGDGFVIGVRDLSGHQGVHERLRMRSLRLLTGHEQIREEVARGLHDNLGAEASSALFRVKRWMEAEGDARVTQDELKTLADELESLVNGIRDAAHDLHPVSLSKLGFAEAIRQATAQMEGSGLKVKTHIDPSVAVLEIPVEMERLLFRAVQETLTNVVRHANASETSVVLMPFRDGVRMLVEDDGVGFRNLEQVQGIGLSSLRDNVRLAGGSCELGTSLSGGAAVTISLPNLTGTEQAETRRGPRGKTAG